MMGKLCALNPWFEDTFQNWSPGLSFLTLAVGATMGSV
jgi:hypothetical protein